MPQVLKKPNAGPKPLFLHWEETSAGGGVGSRPFGRLHQHDGVDPLGPLCYLFSNIYYGSGTILSYFTA